MTCPNLTLERILALIILPFLLLGFGYLLHNVVESKTPEVKVIDRTVSTCRCPKSLVPVLDLAEPEPLND